jgi:mono/diheme cytochrome c family protein
VSITLQELRMALVQTRMTRRKSSRRHCWWLFAALALVMAGCDFPGRPKDNEHVVRAEQDRTFDVLYARNCSGCHGPDGRLGPAPPLNDPLFVTIVPDQVLDSVIRGGRPGTLMPAFAEKQGGALTVAELQTLVSGIKSHWRPAHPPVGGVPVYALPAKPKESPSVATVKRGAAVYARACAGCHGDKGQGESAGAIANPAFLALLSDQALRRLIITGRPDLGMPNYAQTEGRDDDFKPLASAEIDDLVAFVRSIGKQTTVATRRVRSIPSGVLTATVHQASHADEHSR